MLPSPLREAPAGFEATRALVRGLDDALMAGFARLGPAHKDALDAVARAMRATPQGEAIAAVVAAIRGGPPSEAQLIQLAATRESLLGAMHDALMAQALAAVGRSPNPALPAVEPTEAPAAANGLLAGARQWLHEMALGGLLQLDPGAITPFEVTLQGLQEQPELARAAALLTGLFDELSDSVPLDSPDDAPAGRWADLWSRALLACLPTSEQPTSAIVPGRFSAFALESRQHAHFVSAVVWGLWEPNGGSPSIARTTLSGWRVPALAGSEAWHALTRAYSPILKLVSEKKAIVTRAAVLSTGELRIGAADPGLPADPVAVAKQALAASANLPLPSLPPCDRHPIHVAVPVLIEARPKAAGPAMAVAFGDGELPIRLDRLSPLQDIDPAVLATCDSVVGLLRWDGGAWSVQPLHAAGTAGKKAVETGPLALLASEVGSKSDALKILRERASRLLRTKS